MNGRLSATALLASAIFAGRDYRLSPGSPGLTLASDGGPVGARNMPGLDCDQSIR